MQTDTVRVFLESAPDAWGTASNITSVILAILAIALAIYFYVKSKDTEREVSTALAKIETQADALQKLSGRYMDRLTKYVTETQPNRAEHSATQMAAIMQQLSQLPQTIAASVDQPPDTASHEQAVAELVNCYITIYYYAATTNYWAQMWLPGADTFDQDAVLDNLAQRAVDESYNSFQHLDNVIHALEENNPDMLNQSPLLGYLTATRNDLRHLVLPSAQVLIRKQAGTWGAA